MLLLRTTHLPAVIAPVFAALLLWSFGVPVSALRAQSPKRGQTAAMTIRGRIVEIMDEALKRGQGSVKGIHTYTRVPPPGQAVTELRGLGPGAVAVLAEYTSTGTAQQQALAIELLGRIGGRAVIAPLDQVLRTCPSASLREMALRWLPTEGNEASRVILARTAENDSDSGVRALARRRLEEFPVK
jgi:hypothetical protein